jgi:hypothetical protein
LITSLDNVVAGIDNVNQKEAPAWLTKMEKAGFRPYIATTERLLPYFNAAPFGKTAEIFLLEDAKHLPFQEAYALSNALSMEQRDLKMPNWVLVDCVLMQTAIVGFMKSVSEIPAPLLQYYQNDESVDLDQLSHLPVSGQICSLAADGKSLVGFSLFSLGGWLEESDGLGLYTKALALEAYRASQYDYVYGITQYDNFSLRIHGRFAKEMEIHQATVPLHRLKDMTLIYRLSLNYDPYNLDIKPPEREPTFWLRATDRSSKERINKAMSQGKRFIIAPPFLVEREGELCLPIIEENNKEDKNKK